MNLEHITRVGSKNLENKFQLQNIKNTRIFVNKENLLKKRSKETKKIQYFKTSIIVIRFWRNRTQGRKI